LSKIALSGNASGTGTLTIAAPNTNTDRTLTLPDNTGTILTNATAGTVLQVVESRISSVFSTASTSFVDVTNFTASITPSSSSSKILVHANINGGNEDQATYMKILRGSTDVFIGSGSGQVECAAAGARVGGGEAVANTQIVFLDTPSTTSSVTYKLQVRQRDLGTFRLNINNDGTTGSTTKAIAISSIILMEIAA
jgi:hypothetical protein